MFQKYQLFFSLRFAADQTVGLRHAGYVIAVEDLVKDKDGEVVEIIASCKPSTEAPKPKAFIQWVRIMKRLSNLCDFVTRLGRDQRWPIVHDRYICHHHPLLRDFTSHNRNFLRSP